MYDFNGVTIESGSDYITKPGYYNATITEVTLTKPEEKNPYLTVTFETKSGTIQSNFYITQKALSRLKALFSGAWNGKDLTQAFKSPDEVFTFFKSALLKKPNVGIKVQMRKSNNDKLYAELPFSDFISQDFSTFEEKVIEETDSDYNEWILLPRTPQAPKTNETVQTTKSETSTVPAWTEVTDDDSDLPF